MDIDSSFTDQRGLFLEREHVVLPAAGWTDQVRLVAGSVYRLVPVEECEAWMESRSEVRRSRPQRSRPAAAADQAPARSFTPRQSVVPEASRRIGV